MIATEFILTYVFVSNVNHHLVGVGMGVVPISMRVVGVTIVSVVVPGEPAPPILLLLQGAAAQAEREDDVDVFGAFVFARAPERVGRVAAMFVGLEGLRGPGEESLADRHGRGDGGMLRRVSSKARSRRCGRYRKDDGGEEEERQAQQGGGLAASEVLHGR